MEEIYDILVYAWEQVEVNPGVAFVFVGSLFFLGVAVLLGLASVYIWLIERSQFKTRTNSFNKISSDPRLKSNRAIGFVIKKRYINSPGRYYCEHYINKLVYNISSADCDRKSMTVYVFPPSCILDWRDMQWIESVSFLDD